MNFSNDSSNNEKELILLSKQKKLTELSNLALIINNEDEFLQLICKEVTIFTKCSLTGIYKYEISTNQFILVATYQDLLDDDLEILFNDPNTIAGYTFLKEEPVFYDDIKDNQNLSDSPLLKKFNISSGISYTIKNRFGKWGVFGSISLNEKKIFRSDYDFFKGIGDIIALFLEKNSFNDKQLKTNALETAIRLTSRIGHDFNNYLSIIQNYVLLLKEDSLKEKTLPEHDKIQTINNCLTTIGKSRELIEQLQNIIRNRNPNYDEIDINKIIITMKDLLNQKWKYNDSKKIDINYYLYDESPLLITGNASQMSQVILNLVTNAIEAISGNSGIIEIRTEKLLSTNPNNLFEIAHLGLKPTNYVHLKISDNGSGMDKNLIDNIFTPYMTSKKEFSTSGYNLGLGLSIVYENIQQMSGIIKVTSEIDKGTKFDIYLPCSN